MPQLLQNSTLHLSSDNGSRKNSANSSNKVWGNSVLSANFCDAISEAPGDNQDENDIKQIASRNTLRHFLANNDLDVIVDYLPRFQDTTLEQLKTYAEPMIHQFCQANFSDLGPEHVTKLINALLKITPRNSPINN